MRGPTPQLIQSHPCQAMKALIIGATGATGRDLFGVLLQDPDYTAVTAFVTTLIFRPGPLIRRETDRPAERFITLVRKFANSHGLLKYTAPSSLPENGFE
jgi:predicted ATPase